MKLKDKTLECLRNAPNERLTARQIAEWIVKRYPQESNRKLSDSIALETATDLLTQIAAEINGIREYLPKTVKTTDTRPREFYYTLLTDEEESDAVNERATDNYLEHDLYRPLAEYLKIELNTYSLRIDEKRSKNSNGLGANHWLYPDLVGMETLTGGWHREVLDCVKEYGDVKKKLWSFEVKKLVNRANVREYYFQAVSNSSWANFGYLVAAEISGEQTLKELRILAGLHGIGVIVLDRENPSESYIAIPAQEKATVDWHTINRIAVENTDFRQYIAEVRKFYQTGETTETNWDYKEESGLRV